MGEQLDPSYLKTLDYTELEELAGELRYELVATVATTGGHLGPNLGAVELTLALHRVFDSPTDSLVFDTGHQSYVHKMVTGRRELTGLRSRGGVAGYPQRSESEHDLVENSHASVSLSWAHGLALGYQLSGASHRYAVAVIGDGALTGGVAWEALNNISASGLGNLVIVLNDNGRSYDPTVGGIVSLVSGLSDSGHPGENFLATSGFAYFGPIDGHDLPVLEQTLQAAKSANRPSIVHIKTVKGKGYAPALADEDDNFHAVGKIDPVTGSSLASGGSASWTGVFGKALASLAETNPDLVALTGAMRIPVGFRELSDKHPDRVVDVGIAEQHAVAMAAGLATAGKHPVVAVYATFLNRAIDQLLMDVALHRLGVTFVLDRSGITGPDGASHHGIWDLALLQVVPGIRIAAPRDAATLERALAEAIEVDDAPTVIRFPKGSIPQAIQAVGQLESGSELLRRSDGEAILLIGLGPFAQLAMEVAEELDGQGASATVVDPRWVTPMPQDLLELASCYELVVTIEDGIVSGGVGESYALQLANRGASARVLNFGIPTQFVEHAERSELLAEFGLEPKALANAILERMRSL